MIAVKRFIRHGLVISALIHVGILAVALLLALRWPSSQEYAPPPDAMQVQIITEKDMPRYSGTPSMLHTSGTDREGQSQMTAKSEQPPTPPPSPQPQPKDPPQAARNPPPQPQEPKQQESKQQDPQKEPQAAQTKAPPLPQADAAKLAMAQPDPSPTAAQETRPQETSNATPNETPDAPPAASPDTSAAAANAAYLALAGGRLGGGFAAPPVDSPLVGYDYTVPFRELVSSCSTLPPGISRNDAISIIVRIFLNRDGTLTAAPQMLDANPSPAQQALMQTFEAGLQKCQPYTMLPPDQYLQWKSLELIVHPNNYRAQ